MLKTIKHHLKKEDGLGTVEIVLLVAILVGLALIFKEAIVEFLQSILGNIEGVNIDPKDFPD
ncbi:Flp1 family type IVb pilin [Maledivibacter halophilus]|uniref:Putative Flagellin, Flp1-like, domain n=1 Tax=Maledivibacter halophilus TaxID=36842 RepID=A0A1T5IFH0_9FIRM|nr:Flp1 family type IVb pilin [Maledivibacter halophilus]SKC37798.1 Putative Flagellin, Flp1-like, domain [Maledivibacter halophilus]